MTATLASELIRLSEQTHFAYLAALDSNRNDVAVELRLLADKVAALIASTLRVDLAEPAETVVVDVDVVEGRS